MEKCYVCGTGKDKTKLRWSNGDGTGELVCISCSGALERVLELEKALEPFTFHDISIPPGVDDNEVIGVEATAGNIRIARDTLRNSRLCAVCEFNTATERLINKYRVKVHVCAECAREVSRDG